MTGTPFVVHGQHLGWCFTHLATGRGGLKGQLKPLVPEAELRPVPSWAAHLLSHQTLSLNPGLSPQRAEETLFSVQNKNTESGLSNQRRGRV